MAEGEVLETNSLGGEERSPWYECGNWRSGSFTQDYAPSRQAETVNIRLHARFPPYQDGPGCVQQPHHEG
jgi:hypothetical protein